MKLSNLLTIVLLLSIFVYANGTKVVPLPELSKASNITVDQTQLYVTADATVYIFSLSDFKLKKTLGREGEGPQEFKRYADVTAAPGYEYLLVNSSGKVSHFTKNGKFIKEIRTKNMAKAFLPIGKNYVGYKVVWRKNNGRDIETGLYDEELNKLKAICRKESLYLKKRKYKVFYEPQLPVVYKDKIFIVPGQDFIIDVYDNSGQKQYSIRQEYKKIKVTEEHKKEVLDYYKNDALKRRYYDALKRLAQFPEYFPAIRTLIIDDNKIYVQTYKEQEGKSQCVVLDLKGKRLGKIFIPFLEKNPEKSFESLYPFTIKKEKFYQVADNEDTEEWELHITEIK
jgi:hypothetical protein